MKEFHLYMDTQNKNINDLSVDYKSTLNKLLNNENVYTTQSHFLTTKLFDDKYKVFVHHNKDMVEIKLGKNDCTNREIRMGHNLEKLLFGGEFDI